MCCACTEQLRHNPELYALEPHACIILLPLPPAGASWSTTPLPPEERSVLSLRTSYITRVEGCNGHNAIARLTLQTASGARYSQGRGNCLGFFMEEVRGPWRTPCTGCTVPEPWSHDQTAHQYRNYTV